MQFCHIKAEIIYQRKLAASCRPEVALTIEMEFIDILSEKIRSKREFDFTPEPIPPKNAGTPVVVMETVSVSNRNIRV